MKKTTLLSAFLLLFAWGSYAQCLSDHDDSYPGDPVESNNLGIPQTIASNSYTGEYAELTNLSVGGTYIFTCTMGSTEKLITVTDFDNNIIVSGESPLTVESIAFSNIRLHFFDDEECGTTSEPHVTTLQAVLSCTPPINILVYGITTTNASFSWEPQGEETAWEVLVLQADLPAPTASTSGTAVSATPVYTTTELVAADDFIFYVRANCGSEFSPWNKLSFVSGCDPINLFNENFNSTELEELPICWSSIVGGEGINEYAYVETSEYNGVDDSNSVEMYRSDSGPDADIILISPALGNLSLGTHRLKFSSFAYDPATLEIGTMDGFTEGSSFTLVGEELGIQTGNNEYVVDFTSYTGTDTFIGIRMTSGYSVFLDNIRWEVAPLCPDVTQIEVAGTTTTTASFTWNPGGDETAWDVVYGEISVNDPNTLTPISPAPTGTSEASISGLEPGTTYNVWVRSSCGTPNGDGAWIGPKTFTTSCLPVATFDENFDTTDLETLPACWSSIIRGEDTPSSATVYTVDYNTHSGSNSVRLGIYNENETADIDVILVSPNLSTLTTGTHRLKFFADGYTDGSLQIGTLDSASPNAVFTPWDEVEITNEYAEYAVDFTGYDGTDTFVGIRHNGGDYTFLDNIRWELAPLCPDVTQIAVTGITTTTASFSWNPGGDETGWDVVYGAISVNDPSTLTPISPAPTGTSEATISSLEPGTAYNVWVRSSCGAPNGDGAWIGPKTFTTSCLPIATFDENFDNTDLETLPACWSSIIRGEDTPSSATVYTVDYNTHSGSNSVRLGIYNESETADIDVILVSPNLSTLTTGNHRLKFFADGYMNGSIQVGTLDSASPNAVFSSWEEVEITEEYAEYVVDFTGYEGTDTFVGIRHNVGDYTFLDNMRWELAPLCPDVQNISMSEITTVSAVVTWEPGGSETSWQVVRGASDVTDPSTLTPSGLLTESTFVFNELTENTGYNVWVRSACGTPNGDGAWIGPIKFHTLCLSTGVPYIEDFESAQTPELPNCSSAINLSSGNDWGTNSIDDYGFDSNVLQYLYNSDYAADAWFFTQGINLIGGTEYSITYKYGSNSTDYEENLKIMYGQSPDADNMTDEIAVHEAFSFDEAETNQVNFTPSATGTYYFGFNAYSIANQYNIYIDDIMIDNALGRNNFVTNTLKFYPNPVKDVLNLSHTQNISTVAVYNLLGQIVLENAVNANTTTIDMSGLSSGSYLVKVTSENQTKTIKVIKE